MTNPSLPLIIVDTREPVDKAYPLSPSQLRRKLNTGDYSLEGFTDLIAVERKTLPDLMQSIISKRFWVEVGRAAPFFAFAVVIEATPDELSSPALRSGVSPASVLGAVKKILSLGHSVEWAGSRAGAQVWTLEFLRRKHQQLTQEAEMSEQETITGKISRIRHQNEELTFTVGTLDTEAGDHPFFKFFGAVSVGDKVTFTGRFEHDPKWGPQFVARSVAYDLPIEPDGLIRYLVECPAFKGLGVSRAAQLVSSFGAETFTAKMIASTPAEVAAAGKLSLDVATALQAAWLKRSAVNELSTHLAAYDLTDSQIKRIIEKLGAEALPIIKGNPYRLTEVDGFGFKTVDKIALRVGVEKIDKRRLKAGLTAALAGSLAAGHTYSMRPVLKGDAAEVLSLDGTPDQVMGIVEGAIDAALIEGDLLEDAEGRVSLSWVKGAERIIAEQLRSLSEVEPLPQDPEKVIEVLKQTSTYGPVWEQANLDQRVSVFAALRQCGLVITGVAGTGKTTVIKLIIAAFNLAGIADIALCAPTGKAARRLEQVTGRSAQTVHRLIGASPQGYGVEAVEAQVVIVDEASMLDVLLLSALIRRLRYRTHLILVGDINQLPPVGAGAPLRDIIKQRLCPVASLTEVVRQAGRLQRNALQVLDGLIADNDPSAAADKAWFLVKTKTKGAGDGADHRSDAEIARDGLLSLFEQSQTERLGHDPIYQTQILTAQSTGPLGVDHLNQRLQIIFQKKLRGIEVAPPVDENTRPSFMVGDKVIFTKNDYEKGLMNGDVGIVRGLEHSGKGHLKEVVVAWDAVSELDNHRLIPVTRGNLSDLSLAYALTVHKAQGSEYPCAVVVVAKAHAHMHKSTGRAWLYTAVTRAAKSCLLIGDSWGLRNAAAYTAEDKRRTWLALPLSNLMGLPEIDQESIEGQP